MRKSSNYGSVNVVENDRFQYGVTDNNGNVIVPFGKYGWISGYDHGLARVKSIGGSVQIDLQTGAVQNAKWGIIDMEGNEVLPVKYDAVWNFLGKERTSTKVIKDGESHWFLFGSHELLDYAPGTRIHRYSSGWHEPDYDDGYGSHYGEYAGSYAQDVMGYSDDVINDAFDGDPEAYWNID